ncbi:MAG TPA: hypothetical protein VK846_07555 [Candidatus Limnocylindria bacterium]|nr:hypothetical protein [Candidatus Limnocylindria bacterium]
MTLVRVLRSCWNCTALFLLILCGSFAAEPPLIPVGLDAYRMWDRWAHQRIGARAYMRSTYDRRGANEAADASHYLYQESNTFNVALDVQGPGVLYFARYNHWHGSPWHYEVDGVDHIVQESSSANPLQPAANRARVTMTSEFRANDYDRSENRIGQGAMARLFAHPWFSSG